MSDNSRIAKNTIMLYIRMLVVMAVSLYTSRIVLKNLGITDYGLYSLVGGVATTFVFLNSAMSSVTQRYLSVGIGKNDAEHLRKVFNISFTIHTLIGICVVLLCEAVGLWFIYHKMQIPEGRETAVFWVFQISMVITFLSMITAPFSALIISRERMSAFAYISIFDVFYKLFIAYIISVVAFDKLIFYALLLASSQILIISLYFFYCKRHFKECSFRFYRYEELYKEMASFASWELLGHFSNTITTSIQDMMLNAFFSPVVNAARGIALTVSNSVNNFRTNFTMAVEPQITISYACGKWERTMSLIYNSSRFALYLLFLLSLPVFLCVDEILALWLVEVPEYTSAFIRLALINNLILCSATSLNMVIRANGKIKYPSLVGGIILVLNLPISFLLLYSGNPPQSVFWGMIFCSVLAQIVRIYYAHKYVNLPVRNYMIHVFVHPTFVMTISAVIPLVVNLFLVNCDNLEKVIMMTICSSISILVCIYLFGINREEKILLLSVIKSKLHRNNAS